MSDILEKVTELVAQEGRGIRCDFCMKHQREVRGMVAESGGNPAICNECVGLAVDILTRNGRFP